MTLEKYQEIRRDLDDLDITIKNSEVDWVVRELKKVVDKMFAAMPIEGATFP